MNEKIVLWFEFYWSLFLKVQLTISQYWVFSHGMAWRQTGSDKSLPEPMLTQVTDAYTHVWGPRGRFLTTARIRLYLQLLAPHVMYYVGMYAMIKMHVNYLLSGGCDQRRRCCELARDTMNIITRWRERYIQIVYDGFALCLWNGRSVVWGGLQPLFLYVLIWGNYLYESKITRHRYSVVNGHTSDIS